ncbi:metallophosphoesterase family protein [Actinoplanes sp. NPDC051513]|uniref:metallophosphoesterase family protein n=1 Tax=Actinoplanes sp. NPDC051513 TaxID=3363908 RepID=UPI0037B2FBD7
MSSPLVIAHLSDLHLGAHVPASVAAIADEVGAFHPDLTVVTGDHTMRARPREFLQAVDVLDKLPVPRLVVPGNHDLPLVSPLRVTAPYARYRRWIGEDNAVARLPGLTALGINSMPWWRWKSGRVTHAQTTTLRQVMGQASPDSVRVLALHHPPFAGGLARLVGRSRLTRALRAARVDIVLAGHTHVPSVHQSRHGPLVVIAGTATSYRVRDVPRSWTMLRVTAEAVEVHERFESEPGAWHTGRVVRHLRRPH